MSSTHACTSSFDDDLHFSPSGDGKSETAIHIAEPGTYALYHEENMIKTSDEVSMWHIRVYIDRPRVQDISLMALTVNSDFISDCIGSKNPDGTFTDLNQNIYPSLDKLRNNIDLSILKVSEVEPLSEVIEDEQKSLDPLADINDVDIGSIKNLIKTINRPEQDLMIDEAPLSRADERPVT